MKRIKSKKRAQAEDNEGKLRRRDSVVGEEKQEEGNRSKQRGGIIRDVKKEKGVKEFPNLGGRWVSANNRSLCIIFDTSVFQVRLQIKLFQSQTSTIYTLIFRSVRISRGNASFSSSSLFFSGRQERARGEETKRRESPFFPLPLASARVTPRIFIRRYATFLRFLLRGHS